MNHRALLQLGAACGMLALATACANRGRDAAASSGDETTTAETSSEHDAISRRAPNTHTVADDDSGAPPSTGNPPAVQPPPPPDELIVPVVLRPFPHVEVDIEAGEVRFDGIACLDVGWLEQVVCAPQSREHESLIVSEARPSHIHAALLAAGFEPGEPGRWTYENDEIAIIPPRGDEIEVEVIYENRAGDVVRETVRNWIRDHRGEHEFPRTPWVFGGSRLRKAPPSVGEGEVYEADYSGSVIGLVTFGDEVIGWREVLADQESVHPPEWEVNTAHVPTPGTPVQVVLRRAESPGGSE